MISRRELLRVSAAGALGVAMSRAVAAAATQTPASPNLRKLTTADLRALPKLDAPDDVVRTNAKKTFSLVLAAAEVEPLPGHRVAVRAVNGQSPGPLLRVTEGDDVEITVVNHLSQPTSIHWHGIPVDFPMDGSAPISQAPIEPGQQFVYRWVAPQAGTYMYHAHERELEQVSVSGLIVVEPPGARGGPTYVLDLPIMISNLPFERSRAAEAEAVLSDSMMMSSMTANPKADPLPGVGDPMDRMDMVEYWCFNGKTFPATAPIDVKTGDIVRLRFGNLTSMSHPIHLHGHWFRWIAQDGNPLATPSIANTIPVHPGQTIDIDFIANNPGVWPLHCHIVAHMVDNHDAMSGLMTVLRYDGFPLPAAMMRST